MMAGDDRPTRGTQVTDVSATTVALAEAAREGGYAPSIHNTQPWRWRVDGSTLELHAVSDRQLAVTDPAGRMLTISCGAALHHVRVALAATGWAVQIDRVPDESDPELLARVTVTGRTDVTPASVRLLQTLRIRHTDRRPVSDTPVDPDVLERLRHTAAAEGSGLHLLRPDDVIELASAAAHAQDVEGFDDAWRAELAYWVGGSAGAGLGVPDAVIPAEPTATTVPGRDFGHGGSLPVGPGHDRAARYAIVYGADDTRVGWLRAGEALSAVWLAAIEESLGLVPLSAVVEVPGTRRVLRRLLADVGEPFLALRLGVPDPDHAGPPHTPRLAADQVVEVVR
jgi:nitroreductase